MMTKRLVLSVALLTVAGPALALDLPRQITPAVRAACESDVRRMCDRPGVTLRSLKRCVERNFSKLNSSCQMKLVQLRMSWRGR